MKHNKSKSGERGSPPDLVVGIAWYNREEWSELRGVATDAEALEETYDEWLVIAERAIRDIERHGRAVRRVPVKVADLVQWCEEVGRDLDGSARAEFASRELQARDSS